MASFRQQIQFATAADGVKIAFGCSGSGPPLVRAGHWLTHLDWDWQIPVWGPWIQRVSQRYRFIRYDSRGCGLSDRDVPDFGLDQLVDDLSAVVDAAGLQRFALFGVSQGGAVAVAYAARHPQRVSHLLLLDAFVRGEVVRDPGQRNKIHAIAQLLLDGWGQDNPAFRQLFTTQFFPGATREQSDGFNELQRLSCSPAHAARIVHVHSLLDASPYLSRIECPTLVMHCRGDARVPFDEGRYVASSIPLARFEALESPNHFPLPGEPAFEQLLSRVHEFLPVAGAGAGAFALLSPREREVVELLARGLDNAQIGAHLGLAEKTVRNNVSALFGKLGAETRAQAIVRARDAGFGRGAPG